MSFISPDIITQLYVDDPARHSDKLPVFINITLPRMKCETLGLDLQDDEGVHEVGMADVATKTPVFTGSVEGCRFESHFLINKVPGNFHVSTHSMDLLSQPMSPDMGHTIHEVRFGQKHYDELNVLEGSFNPLLDNDETETEVQATHDYIVRIVPTVYQDSSDDILYPYQYTYSHRSLKMQGGGGAIWFRYELSPITVKYHAKRKPLYHFLTTVCAIIGGTFTVTGIINSCICTAAEIYKKAELGKLS